MVPALILPDIFLFSDYFFSFMIVLSVLTFPGSAFVHFREIIRIGQDDHGGRRITCCTYRIQIRLDQYIPCFYLCAVGYFLSKTFPLQFDRINSYVDEEFAARLCGKAYRMPVSNT